MDNDYLTLKRASASRPSGQWSEKRLRRARRWRRRRSHHESARRAGGFALDVDAGLRPSRRPLANAWLRADMRGRDGDIRKELAAGMTLTRHRPVRFAVERARSRPHR